MIRRRALLVLLGLAVLSLLLPWKPIPAGTVRPGFDGGGADQSLFLATVSRLHGGEPYYPVVGDELRRRHYPTASPFNWRTPLLHSALALSPPVARGVFIGLIVLVLVTSVRLLASHDPFVAIAGALAQSGNIGLMFDPEVWVFPEVWAGCLIALSVSAYAARRVSPAAVLGLLALFARELAAPYAVCCLTLAARAGRKREIYLWLGGLAVYGLYYGWHLTAVFAQQHAAEPSHAAGWIQFGGLPFLVETLRTNSLLHRAAAGVVCTAFIVLIAGLFASDLPVHARCVAMVYLIVFAAVGQPFNWYWGWLPGFVYPLIFAHGLPVGWGLLKGARVALTSETIARR